MRRSFPWPSAPQESKDSCRVMEGSVGAAVGWGGGTPQVNAQWGLWLPFLDPSSGLRVEVSDSPTEILSPKAKDTCLGGALPGLALRRAELQAHLCPFFAV